LFAVIGVGVLAQLFGGNAVIALAVAMLVLVTIRARSRVPRTFRCCRRP
jgi:hypothetical protein